MAELNNLQPNIDNSQSLLSDLTSTSRVAVWRLIFFVVAVAIWTHEKLFDDHVTWINNKANELIVGSLSWYHTKSLNFQYGDSLDKVNDVFQYPIINSSNQIIKLASVNESSGQLFLKVAKLNGDTPEPLTNDELNAFIYYINKIKFAGVIINCLSRDADLLKIYYKIYYDPLVLNSNGELISSPGVFPVEDTINNYCKNLPFDGVLNITSLTDLIQNTQGVFNPVYISSSAKYGTNPYYPITDYYNANAGYLKIDPAFELSSTIQYISL